MQAERLEADIDMVKQSIAESKDRQPNIRAQTDLNLELGAKAIADTQNAKQSEALLKEQTAEVYERRMNEEKMGKILDENLHSAQRAATVDKQREEFFKTPEGRLALKLGTFGQTINPFMGTTNSARDLIRR